MFFTEEQKELLEEINKLESQRDKCIDERKTLTVAMRVEIVNKIISKYSMLKKQKGILHEQIFSAMEDYLKTCTETGYKLKGL